MQLDIHVIFLVSYEIPCKPCSLCLFITIWEQFDVKGIHDEQVFKVLFFSLEPFTSLVQISITIASFNFESTALFNSICLRLVCHNDFWIRKLFQIFRLLHFSIPRNSESSRVCKTFYNRNRLHRVVRSKFYRGYGLEFLLFDVIKRFCRRNFWLLWLYLSFNLRQNCEIKATCIELGVCFVFYKECNSDDVHSYKLINQQSWDCP